MREDAAHGDISAVHMDGVDSWEVSQAQQGSESKVEHPLILSLWIRARTATSAQDVMLVVFGVSLFSCGERIGSSAFLHGHLKWLGFRSMKYMVIRQSCQLLEALAFLVFSPLTHGNRWPGFIVDEGHDCLQISPRCSSRLCIAHERGRWIHWRTYWTRFGEDSVVTGLVRLTCFCRVSCCVSIVLCTIRVSKLTMRWNTSVHSLLSGRPPPCLDVWISVR